LLAFGALKSKEGETGATPGIAKVYRIFWLAESAEIVAAKSFVADETGTGKDQCQRGR